MAGAVLYVTPDGEHVYQVLPYGGEHNPMMALELGESVTRQVQAAEHGHPGRESTRVLFVRMREATRHAPLGERTEGWWSWLDWLGQVRRRSQ